MGRARSESNSSSSGEEEVQTKKQSSESSDSSPPPQKKTRKKKHMKKPSKKSRKEEGNDYLNFVWVGTYLNTFCRISVKQKQKAAAIIKLMSCAKVHHAGKSGRGALEGAAGISMTPGLASHRDVLGDIMVATRVFKTGCALKYQSILADFYRIGSWGTLGGPSLYWCNIRFVLSI